MRVAVNMSRDTYEYFKDCDLSALADALLETYDITTLPPISGKREVERVVNVSNPHYISLYNTVGARSKLVSLGRLFSFAHEMDVLNTPTFSIYERETIDDPVPTLLERAYRALLEANKHLNDSMLRDIVRIVNTYREDYKKR